MKSISCYVVGSICELCVLEKWYNVPTKLGMLTGKSNGNES